MAAGSSTISNWFIKAEGINRVSFDWSPQAVPGKGRNMLFRLYGPLEPWFDKMIQRFT